VSGTPVDSGNELAQVALALMTSAAFVVPAVWPLVTETLNAQCDPGMMYEAGQVWQQVADELDKAITAVGDLTNSTAVQGWEGADKDAFINKMNDFTVQLQSTQVLAQLVSYTMIAAAIESFFLIVELAFIAGALAVVAAIILAATASIVGNLGVSETLEAEASAFAAEAKSMIAGLNKGKDVVDMAAAAAIGTFMVGDVIGQATHGNPGAVLDLVKSQVQSLPVVAGGLLSLNARDRLSNSAGYMPDKDLPTSIFNNRTRTNDVSALVALVFAKTGAPWDLIFDQHDGTLDPFPR
jgi:hypothetical protein